MWMARCLVHAAIKTLVPIVERELAWDMSWFSSYLAICPSCSLLNRLRLVAFRGAYSPTSFELLIKTAPAMGHIFSSVCTVCMLGTFEVEWKLTFVIWRRVVATWSANIIWPSDEAFCNSLWAATPSPGVLVVHGFGGTPTITSVG
jgi:hypothetical protein